jgi:Ca2+-binding RTX toxin-like protein
VHRCFKLSPRKRPGRRVRRPGLGCLVAALATSALAPAPAAASFPGTNGRIAYARSGAPGSGSQIYVMNANGSGQTPLTPPQTGPPRSSYSPSFTPTGLELTFGSDRDSEPDIYEMNANGSGVRNLTNALPGSQIEPFYIPLNNQFDLGFSGFAGGVFDIYFMKENGSNLFNATANIGADSFTGDADTNKLLFGNTSGGNADIFSVNLDGSGLQNLTATNTTSDQAPKISPNWEYAVFERFDSAGGDYDIWGMAINGTNQQNLTAGFPGDEFQATFAPKGNEIVFSSDAGGGGSDLYKMQVKLADDDRAQASQAGAVNLTNSPGVSEFSASWQPVNKCGGKNATLVGTLGNDKLRGTKKADVVAGLDGKDKISGLGGNDRLCGGKGKDRLAGGKGRDKLDGGKGKDRCSGGPGKDKAKGCEKGKR